MEQKRENAKRIAVGIVILCIAIAIFAGAYFALTPETAEGNKTIRVEIVINSKDNTDITDSTSNTGKTVTIQTDAEYLRQALDEHDLIEGDESEFGLFIKAVDGVTADDSRQEWWCITKSGEQVMTGVDLTPIADGEHYEITLVAGY